MDETSPFTEPGQRLLPAVIDELSINDPDRIFVSYPIGLHPRDGYRDVTYKEFAAAINCYAWWIENNLGRSDEFKTLTYFGPQDLQTIILVYSSIKTGHKLFLSSLRDNLLDNHLKLLDDLDCGIMLTSEKRLPVVDNILLRRAMQTLTVPALDGVLVAEEVSAYPYNKTFSQAKDDPFVVLHTSGSTGLPKPVILNHGTMAHHDFFLKASSLGGKPLNLAHFSGRRVLFGLPIVHSAAMCFVAFSIYSNTTPVLASWPVLAETVNQAIQLARIDSAFLLPNIIVDISQKPEYFENIKRLRYLTFGGAPLSREIGNKVKELTHLFVSFGATETGFYALEQTDSDDWEYYRFSPMMGFELRPFSGDLYEFVFVRDGSPGKSQGVFSTFPKLEEYSAKDLFSKHLTKEGLWRYEGRADDAIALSTGVKINPREMEDILNAHPAVNSAIVCGEGRTQAALVIEAKAPPETVQERSSLLEEVWPSIERANKTKVRGAEISKGLILFTTIKAPMIRATKGSVQRKMTIELYSSELDEIYISHANTLQG